jgi:NAD(P)-dependent dehydrogenase (short-subunit alcohol dehydrogenase family)
MSGCCEGRIAIVTGAGQGIGRGHALELARQGARVVVNDLGWRSMVPRSHSPSAEQVVAEITAAGGIAIADVNDASDTEGAKRAWCKLAIETFGGLDIVVNNAGVLRDTVLVNLSPDDWDTVLRVHLRSTFAVTQAAATWWRTRSKAGEPVDGRVINTTSGAGLYGNVGQTNYAAAKAGIVGFTLAASLELSRYGVTVNAVAPGGRTRMTEQVFAGVMTDTKRRLRLVRPGQRGPPGGLAGLARGGRRDGRVMEAWGGRIAVVEGWHPGPTIEVQRRWDPNELGPVVHDLLARAAPRVSMVQTTERARRLGARLVKFGFAIPAYGSWIDRAQVWALIEAGEELGYESVWWPDHIAVPDYGRDYLLAAPLPRAPGRVRVGSGPDAPDPLRDRRPGRALPPPPAGGRHGGDLGPPRTGPLGPRGRHRVPAWRIRGTGRSPYEQRAEVTEEFLRVFRHPPEGFSLMPSGTSRCGSAGTASGPSAAPRCSVTAGTHCGCRPRPMPRARDSILVSGPKAGLPAEFTFSYSCGATKVLDVDRAGLAGAEGRAPVGTEFSYAPAAMVAEGNRPRFVGTPDQLVEDFGLLARAGVDHVTLRFGSTDISQLERFANEVWPDLARRAAAPSLKATPVNAQ